MVAKPRIRPDSPSGNLVDLYYHMFETDDRYALGDRALLRLVELMPTNTCLEEILIKTCAINSLYSTQVYATVEMAKHIHSLRIDGLLRVSDPEAVTKISKLEVKGKIRNCYSFASKYCSWHDQDNYPIFDTFVQSILLAYQEHYRFSDFQPEDLRAYNNFKRVIQDFRRFFGLEAYSVKRLDKFLWLYSKHLHGVST